MEGIQGQMAVELLRQCANDNGCKNGTLLDDILGLTKRHVDPSLTFWGNDGSNDEKRKMLPTPSNLRLAITKELLNCGCTLCKMGGERSLGNGASLEDDEIKDCAKLILCGCLFITRQPKYASSKDLSAFYVAVERDRKEQSKIFGGVAAQPSSCNRPHGDNVPWSAVDHLGDVCDRCRWEAFKAAYDLKGPMIEVPNLRAKDQQALLNGSCINIPFINQVKVDTQRPSGPNKRFIASEIHEEFAPNGFKGKQVFRKVYAYQAQDEAKIEEAKKEAEFAHKMSRKHHNIAQLLFAFHDSDSGFEIVELVFKWYKHNLDEVFSEMCREPTCFQRDKTYFELVDHTLWKAILKVVEAVSEVHGSLQSSCPLDIKPANILVDLHTQDGISLYLTDFGHIAESTPREATVTYAPPPRNVYGKWAIDGGTTYDAWSMACVLLQVLAFIDGGYSSTKLATFNSERHGEYDNAAFWRGTFPNYSLRKPVEKKFEALREPERHRTRDVVAQVQKMMSITPEDRGKMAANVELLYRARYDRLPKSQDMMMCGCENWSVFYQNLDLEEVYPAKLAVYRDPKHRLGVVNRTPGEQARNEHISIDLSFGEARSRMSTGDCLDISFAPAEFWVFDATKTRRKEIRCKSLLSDYTLLFADMHEYRKFITLLTRQYITSVVDSEGYRGEPDFLIDTCTVNEGFVNEGSRYGKGRVQIWKMLSATEYDKMFNRIRQTVDPGQGANEKRNNPDEEEGQRTIWKLVVWAHDSKGRKACIVCDIGEKTWDIKNSNKGTRNLTVTSRSTKRMRGAIFQECTKPDSRSTQHYAYVPIDPTQLQGKLQEKVVKRLDMGFQSPEAKDRFRRSIDRFQLR